MKFSQDLFSFLISFGVVQGVFLSYFFLVTRHRQLLSNRLLGCMLLSLSMMILEIFLCYSGYIVYVLHFVDASEPMNFVLAPLLYLYVRSHFSGRFKPKHYLHFLPFVLYTTYSLFFFLQGTDFKYNAFLSAYHPDAPRIPALQTFDADPLGIKAHVNLLAIVQVVTYLLLSFYRLHRISRAEGSSLLASHNPKVLWLRNMIMQVSVVVGIWLFAHTYYRNDLGDHLLAAYITVVIYLVSFRVIRDSLFFSSGDLQPEAVVEVPEEPEPVRKKYSKSALSEQAKQEILLKLQQGMEQEKYYLDNLLSLGELAKKINVPSHHISQVLSLELNRSFFEFISDYRIREAQRLLSDPANASMKIEEVAERVGYNSKSAFNTAFRKYTGKTPSEFRGSV